MNSTPFQLSKAGRATLIASAAAIATLNWAPQARPADVTSVPKVTFSKDIAPLLEHSCQSCHHPGSIAPMSLITYQQVRPWARSIREKVVSRDMPPWYIDHGVGLHKFKDDPSLS